ncbi:MAG: glycoside hydrolase, partial [Clostridia bacterium]|nr:glycoside hydrolase [Clostridia bacterium]
MTTRLRTDGDGVVRVTRTKRDHFLTSRSPALNPAAGDAEYSLLDSANDIRSGNVTVRVNADTGALTFLNDEGMVLLREPDADPFFLDDKPVYLNLYNDETAVHEDMSVDGVRAYASPAQTVHDRDAYECRQNFIFDENEGLYGLGSHEEGFGNLRGRNRTLYQHNMKAVVPVLVSTKGWGLFFDMGCMMAFHDDEEGSCVWADCADELDWYLFYGDGSYASAMALYRGLTGPTPMLPRYALGYVQSKERYVSAQEMLDVAREYRRRHVPLDVLVLDWQSWPEGQWGFKSFDKTRFPNPAAFIDELHDLDVHLMISIWPSMRGEANDDRHEMLQHGYMLGNRLIYDAFNHDARTLYWRQANDGLFSKGVDAWWCDCSEPFESDWHGSVRPDPSCRAIANTDEAKRYLDPAKLSLYSLHHAMGMYEGQRGVSGQKRVLNLTRSSWAGQHRYAAVTWSGDIGARWETLRRQVPEGLNFCATGEPYWTTDTGAFFVKRIPGLWFWNGDFDEGVDDPGYRELFVRWMQYSAFLPMMRAHGTDTPREIWRFGEEGTPFYDAIAEAIRLRYSLVPYLYNLMAQTHLTGAPMLCVPALVFPQDEALRSVSDQMMLGGNILVKPVTRPMYYMPGGKPVESPDEAIDVLLPRGHRWYHLDSGAVFDGGQRVRVRAPLHTLPVFVRSGAIIPWGRPADSTEDQAGRTIDIVIDPGEDACLNLYDDEGDGYGPEMTEAFNVLFNGAVKGVCSHPEQEEEPETFDRFYRPVYDESNLQEEEAERAAIRYEHTHHRSLKSV